MVFQFIQIKKKQTQLTPFETHVKIKYTVEINKNTI